MGYSNLTLDEYAKLSLDDYAQMSLDGGSGTDSGSTVSCVWNETRIASLESSISELKTMIQTLQTKVNSLPTATYTVPTASQIATSVWSASSRTVTNSIPTVAQIQNGLATSANITTLQNHGDTKWKTATGFATPEDVKLTTTTQEVNVTSADVSGLATLESVSELKTLVEALPTETVNVTTQTVDVSSLATSAQVSALQTSVNAIPNETKIANKVWNRTEGETRTITGFVSLSANTINTIRDGLATVDDVQLTTTTETVNVTTQNVDVSGLATKQQVTDLATAVSALPTDLTVTTEKVEVTSQTVDVSEIVSSVETLSGKIDALPTEPVQVTTETVEVVQQTVDVSSLATSASISELKTLVEAIPTEPVNVTTQNVDVSGLATKEQVETLQESVSALPTEPVQVTTQEVNVTTQDVDISGLATNESVSELRTAIEAIPTETVDISGLATSTEMETLRESVDALPTAKQVWEYEDRTLTVYNHGNPDGELSGNRYCTIKDVERRWGINNVRAWGDLDNDNNTTKIQEQIEWAIESASRRIDSDLLSSMYVTPFSPVPETVRAKCAILAGIELYSSRRMQETEDSNLISTAMSEYHAWISYVLGGGIIAGAQLFVSEV